MQVYHHSILDCQACVVVERGQWALAKPEVSRKSDKTDLYIVSIYAQHM